MAGVSPGLLLFKSYGLVSHSVRVFILNRGNRLPGDRNFIIQHFMDLKLSNSGDITANPNGVELLIAPGETRGPEI